MTLNITVLTRPVVYQSADFRLTDPSSGKLDTDRSPKMISLRYPGWHGFVTYTGLGRTWRRPMSTSVVQWLSGDRDLTMTAVAERLAARGSALLRQVGGGKEYAHTFVLAGFDDTGAHLFVASNIEDCFNQTHAAVADDLTVTQRKLRHGEDAVVVVTGQSPAVTPAERNGLRSLATRYRGSHRPCRNDTSRTPRPRGLHQPGGAVRRDRGLTRADQDSVVPRALLSGLTAIAENAPPHARMIVPVHADYHWGNWLASDGNVTALLDFEWARFGEPLDDWFFLIADSGAHLETVLDVIARETATPAESLRADCEIREAAYLASDLRLTLLRPGGASARIFTQRLRRLKVIVERAWWRSTR